MKKITLYQRIKIVFLYCLPAFTACGLLGNLYHGRINEIGAYIKVQCEDLGNEQCELIHNIDCANLKEGEITLSQICKYREKFARDIGYQLSGSQAENTGEGVSSGMALPTPITTKAQPENCSDYPEGAKCFVDKLTADVDAKLWDIFIYNIAAVFLMVLLPYLLMGDLLSKSDRINLDYKQRCLVVNANWWLKFITALIMTLGWIYIINPLGRGGSTYYQFFIAVGLENETTLPIFVQVESIVPVLAGFFGWYLHLIGYIFTKLIHHDVISSRVYNLLFKKFIVIYGIALVLPDAGLLEDPKNAVFFMFLVGLFPLSAMSILTEAVSKIGSGANKSTGSLSQLPGISRWQILRLEEEGVDSMASLANIKPSAVQKNLQFIEKLTLFWMDIAQLYTIVGHDAYHKIKTHCLTASEFVRNAEEPDFVASINSLEGVGQAKEIARLIENTFEQKLLAQRSTA